MNQQGQRRATDGTCCVCSKPIGVGYLMCQSHWHRVPGRLRNQVTSAWGRLQRSKGDKAQHTSALNDYRAARDAAMTAVSCNPDSPPNPLEQDQ